MASLLKLEDYQVSVTHGFLPPEPPLERLPDYYNEWETICSGLYKLRIENQLAEKVTLLPVLSTKHLENEPAWRRAYVLLGFIMNAYIWGPAKALKILPANIAVPFIQVSEHLGMPPVATYGAQNLWNYRPLNPSRSIANPDNFCALTTFTDSPDESWFFAVPAAIEARGAPIIPLTLETFSAASLGESEKIITCLGQIRGHIEALSALLPRMYEKCNPTIFYCNIRPFLVGTTSAEPSEGVFYAEENGKGSHRIHQGPTAAQSSLFQFLDISFGVRHRPTGTLQERNSNVNDVPGREDEFLKNMRLYMPRGHRRFLRDISKIANIRQYITSNRKNTALQEAYDSCLEELLIYRNKHIQIVSRYIVVPARAATQSSLSQTEPGTAGGVPAAMNATASKTVLGTGGTAPVEFLKQVRNETRESLLRA